MSTVSVFSRQCIISFDPTDPAGTVSVISLLALDPVYWGSGVYKRHFIDLLKRYRQDVAWPTDWAHRNLPEELRLLWQSTG